MIKLNCNWYQHSQDQMCTYRYEFNDIIYVRSYGSASASPPIDEVIIKPQVL